MKKLLTYSFLCLFALSFSAATCSKCSNDDAQDDQQMMGDESAPEDTSMDQEDNHDHGDEGSEDSAE